MIYFRNHVALTATEVEIGLNAEEMKIRYGEEIYAMVVTCAGLVVIWGGMVFLAVRTVFKSSELAATGA